MVRLSKAFWKDRPDFPRCILTDEVTRGTYFFDFPDTESGVVCLSYTWGDDSVKFLALDTEERVELCLRTLRGILGEDPFTPLLEESHSVSWELQPGNYGAFKLTLPGQYNDQWSLIRQGCGFDQPTGLFLAGDSVSWAGGWIEGALQSALNASGAVVHHLGGHLQGGFLGLEEHPAR